MNKLIERFFSKDVFIFSFIFISLMIAFGPAYLVDYFRHDDFASACWDRISITTHHVFGNSVHTEFRPYTMIFMFYSELFAEYLSGAKFVKIATIAVFSFSSLLLFKWLRIFNINKMWALFLAIILFTLPPMQIMAATYHYFFMAVPVLLSSIVIFIIWDIQNKNSSNISRILKLILFLQLITFLTFYNKFILYSTIFSVIAIFLYNRCKNNTFDKRTAQFLYFSSFVIFLIAITAYPPSAMFVWFLLAVTLLMIFQSNYPKKIINFSIKVFIFSIWTMIVYFTLGKLNSQGIDTNHMRGFSLTGDISKLFLHTLDAVRIGSNLWDITENLKQFNGGMFNDFDKLTIILSTFILALMLLSKKINKRNTAIIFICVLMLVCLSISPAIVSQNSDTMFRYIIALTPLVGFIFFWSLSIIFSHNNKYYKYFLTTILGAFFVSIISSTNYNIYKTIVEPNQHEMNFISNILDREVIPKIKNKEKVLIQVVRGKLFYTTMHYSRDEFGAGLNFFRWPINFAIVMLLKDEGIKTKSPCHPTIWDDEYAKYENNWGTIEIFNDSASQKANIPKEDYILMDMSELIMIHEVEEK